MSDEEKTAEKPTMDVYIRMNEDSEKDYCFNVESDAPLSSLQKIFETLPMVLSPSYFYNPRPLGFAVSMEPGFLTSEGGLLFSSDAHVEEKLKKVDQKTKVRDAAWEGQLIVPLWEYNYTRLISIVSILGFWLYLDLPEYIHPTPGYAPTTLFYNFTTWLIPALADDTPSKFSNVWWQWGFFALHCLKVGFIYLLIWVGGVNPVSFNPVVNRRSLKKEITREILLDIGWTGARRATPHEWREENRKTKIEAAGGIVPAYHAGILDGIASAGVRLGAGEGWDSENADKNPVEGKFVIDGSYFKQLYRPLAEKLANDELSTEEKSTAIRNFRRSGPEEGTEEIHERYKARKALGDGTLKPASTSSSD